MSKALRDRAYRETVHRHGNVTLPASVRAALHVEEGDEVAFVDTGNGIVVCPADQAWYWTPEWQEGEREADEDIAAGRVQGPYTDDELLDAFDEVRGDA